MEMMIDRQKQVERLAIEKAEKMASQESAYNDSYSAGFNGFESWVESESISVDIVERVAKRGLLRYPFVPDSKYDNEAYALGFKDAAKKMAADMDAKYEENMRAISQI